MNSDEPKVIHKVAGQPMVRWVVDAVREAGATPIVLVVGYGADAVKAAFQGDDADILYADQDEQLGTGHATLCAASTLAGFTGDVLVLAGDGPLIRAETIRTMYQRHIETGAAATLATSHIDDPTGYGRVVRDSNGRFQQIVEHKNATDEQKAINEVYPSYACFDAGLLFETLRELEPDAVSGEYYVTTVPDQLNAHRHRVEVVDAVPPEDVLSINTPEQLAQVSAILEARVGAGRTTATESTS